MAEQAAGPGAQRFAVIALDKTGAPAYLRIDRKTGALSYCQKQKDIWQCDSLPDKQSIEQQLARLKVRIAALEHYQKTRERQNLLHRLQTMEYTAIGRLFHMVSALKQTVAPPSRPN